jgi:hypothetical protein
MEEQGLGAFTKARGYGQGGDDASAFRLYHKARLQSNEAGLFFVVDN